MIKEGVAHFLDGHEENILQYEEYLTGSEEEAEFTTQSGEYRYYSFTKTLNSGIMYRIHQFYNVQNNRQANIQYITIVKQEKKTAGIIKFQ